MNPVTPRTKGQGFSFLYERFSFLPGLKAWGVRSNGANRFFGVVLVGSILVRLILIRVTLHGDLFYIWSLPTLAFQGVWDPYSWATAHYRWIAESSYDVYYPPAAYVVNAGWLFLLEPLSSRLTPWLQRSRELVLNPSNVPLATYVATLSLPERMINISLLKLPNVVYELIVLWGLIHLVSRRYQNTTLLLWLINPITIYTGYMMGQMDLLTAAFVVLAVKWGSLAKTGRSVFSLVLSIMVKTLPIVLLPPFLLARESWGKRISFGLLFIAVFILGNLFWATDLDRLTIAYFPPVMHSVIEWRLRPDVAIAAVKLLGAVGVGGFFLWQIYRNRLTRLTRRLWELTLVTLLLFFSSYRGILINHFVVLLPFLTLMWAKNPHPFRHMLAFSFLVFGGYVYTRPLQAELFIPLGLNWLVDIPSTRELVNPLITYEHLALLMTTLLGGWMLLTAIETIKSLMVSAREEKGE